MPYGIDQNDMEDQANINGQPMNMQPPFDPSQMGAPPQAQASGPSQQLMQMLNSPEYKDKLQKLAQATQDALAQQRQGVQESQNIYDQAKGPQGRDMRPQAAFISSMTGPGIHPTAIDWSKYAPGPMEKQQMLMKLNQQLQQEKQGLTDKELANMKEQLAGPQSPLNTMKQLAQMDYYNRYNEGGGAYNLAQQQRDFHEHQGVLKSIDTDKTNVQRLANTSNIANSLNNFMNAEISSPAQLEELQQSIRGSLGIKGPGGVNERESTYLKSYAGELAKLQGYWQGPQDLKDPVKGPIIRQTIDHLKNLAQMEQSNFQNQADQRMKALVAGHETVYQRNPQLYGDLQNKINAAKAQYAIQPTKELPQVKGKGKPAPSEGPQPGDIEDGHKFKGGDPANKDNWEEVK